MSDEAKNIRSLIEAINRVMTLSAELGYSSPSFMLHDVNIETLREVSPEVVLDSLVQPDYTPIRVSLTARLPGVTFFGKTTP